MYKPCGSCAVEVPTRSNGLITRSIEAPTRSTGLITHAVELPTRSNGLSTHSFDRLESPFDRRIHSIEQLGHPFRKNKLHPFIRLDRAVHFMAWIGFIQCSFLTTWRRASKTSTRDKLTEKKLTRQGILIIKLCLQS